MKVDKLNNLRNLRQGFLSQVDTIGMKIMLCLLMFLVPLGMLLYFFVESENTSINFAQKEIYGVKYIDPLYQLTFLVPYRQTLMQDYIFGNKKQEFAIKKVDEIIKMQLHKVSDVNNAYSDELFAEHLHHEIMHDVKSSGSIQTKTHNKFLKLVNSFNELRGEALELNVIRSNRMHFALNNQVMDLIRHVGDVSNLILDPDLDTYYLMDLSVVKLPRILKTIGELNIKVSLYLSNKYAQTPDAKADIDILKFKLDELLEDSLQSLATSKEHNPLDNISTNINPYQDEYKKSMHSLLNFLNVELLSAIKPKIEAREYMEYAKFATTHSAQMYTKVNEELVYLLEERIKLFEEQRDQHLLLSMFFLMISLLMVSVVTRKIAFSLNSVIGSFNEIGSGNYASNIIIDRNDEIGKVQRSLEIMRNDLKTRVESEKEIAAENSRIKQALDNSSTPTMLVDTDFNIIYFNNSLRSTFKIHEKEIMKAIEGFAIENIKSTNLESFYPEIASGVGKSLTIEGSSHECEIRLSNAYFLLRLSPVISNDGEKLGIIAEWKNRTDEIAIEKEIDKLVSSASNGELEGRINLDKKNGFYLTLSKGLNSLVDIFERVVADMIVSLEAMAKGDLTKSISSEYNGAFGRLKEDTNSTLDKLKAILSKIRKSSAHITNVSSEIAQGNSSLSQRTEAQAASLEETSASMEEMTQGVKRNSENILQAKELVTIAGDKAKDGGEVVVKAVEAMEELNSSSSMIVNIIEVINDIAFQTNLLALNASVEAARAGEQGKGFAVVAGEVRNLAQRSAKSATEIKELIENSADKITNGVDLVNKSGEHLKVIIESVSKVHEITERVNQDAREQTEGISQVNSAISQMDDMTQQNAALVEQVAAAGQSMTDQAGDLLQLVDFFSTESNNKDNNTDFDVDSKDDSTSY